LAGFHKIHYDLLLIIRQQLTFWANLHFVVTGVSHQATVLRLLIPPTRPTCVVTQWPRTKGRSNAKRSRLITARCIRCMRTAGDAHAASGCAGFVSWRRTCLNVFNRFGW